MTVPQYHLKYRNAFRRIRSYSDFAPIEVAKSAGTAIAVPYSERMLNGKTMSP